MKKRNTPWSAEEETLLAQAAIEKISPARLSVRLCRSEASIKRRMRELGLAGNSAVRRTPVASKDLRVLALSWLEACRARDLAKLIEFYRLDAVLDCRCDAAVFIGTHAIIGYWKPKLLSAVPGAFECIQLEVDGTEIVLDYISYAGREVRVRFSVDTFGKIVSSQCGPKICAPLAA